MIAPSQTSTLLFDIDGTLAQLSNFDADLTKITPKRDILQIAKAAQNVGKMAIVTARPESSRKDTETWIKAQGLDPKFLLMRGTGDTRPDFEVRVDQVRELMKKLGNNVILYDDKLSNCRAVEKALGVICIHISQK